LNLLARQLPPQLDAPRERDHFRPEPLKVSLRDAVKNDVALALDIEVASRERIFFLGLFRAAVHFVVYQ